MLQFIEPDKRAPFKAIVGPANEVGDYDVQAFSEFYNYFFFNYDVEIATKILNDNINIDKETFHCVTADYCIKRFKAPNTKADYWKKSCYETAQLERIKNPEKYQGMSLHEVKEIVEKDSIDILKREVSKHEDFFLMKDLRKHNAQ